MDIVTAKNKKQTDGYCTSPTAYRFSTRCAPKNNFCKCRQTNQKHTVSATPRRVCLTAFPPVGTGRLAVNASVKIEGAGNKTAAINGGFSYVVPGDLEIR